MAEAAASVAVPHPIATPPSPPRVHPPLPQPLTSPAPSHAPPHSQDALDELRALLSEDEWDALQQVTSPATYFT